MCDCFKYLLTTKCRKPILKFIWSTWKHWWNKTEDRIFPVRVRTISRNFEIYFLEFPWEIVQSGVILAQVAQVPLGTVNMTFRNSGITRVFIGIKRSYRIVQNITGKNNKVDLPFLVVRITCFFMAFGEKYREAKTGYNRSETPPNAIKMHVIHTTRKAG